MPQQDVVDTSMSLLKCPPHKQEGRTRFISERGFSPVRSGQARVTRTLVNATLDPGQASPPLLCTAIGDEATSRANMRCATATTRE